MVGKTLSRQLKHGRLSWIGKPLYEGLIAAELAYLRRRDSRYPTAPSPLVDEQLTALIKTFERPKTLKRLIESIRRLYTQMRIIVADDRIRGSNAWIMPTFSPGPKGS